MVLALLGFSDATLGAALSVAWVVVLGAALYRYWTGDRSGERLYAVGSAGFLWLAYGLLQVSSAFSPPIEYLVVAVAAASFCVGVGVAVRWWRHRSGPSDAGTTA